MSVGPAKPCEPIYILTRAVSRLGPFFLGDGQTLVGQTLVSTVSRTVISTRTSRIFVYIEA